jgi:hypothetical protein
VARAGGALPADRPIASVESSAALQYNICPTTTIDAVIQHDNKRVLEQMRWGLCPSWWKKTLKELPATFNARAETVAEKPMFRSIQTHPLPDPRLRLLRMESHPGRQAAVLIHRQRWLGAFVRRALGRVAKP